MFEYLTVCFVLENFSETFLEKLFVGSNELRPCFSIFLKSKYLKWSTRPSSWCLSDAPGSHALLYTRKTHLKNDFWHGASSWSKPILKNVFYKFFSQSLGPNRIVGTSWTQIIKIETLFNDFSLAQKNLFNVNCQAFALPSTAKPAVKTSSCEKAL